jgi:hypothetical protein
MGRVRWFKYDTCSVCKVGPGQRCVDLRRMREARLMGKAVTNWPHRGRRRMK